MKISIQTMAVDSFVPMLESLAAILDKGEASGDPDLINARLAPDMYTLAQQVQQACHYARDGVARLAGQPPATMEAAETSFAGLRAQVARTIDLVCAVPAEAFDGAEERDCSIEIANGMVIEMDGLQLIRAWSLPHFYFHLVTAYDILRNRGVALSKQDYLSQVAGLIRRKAG